MTKNNDNRQRILDVAEQRFMQKGYKPVTLREIGEAVGMRHASLYYYVPGGKQQLFIDVMERTFVRHRHGLADAIDTAGDDLRDQLIAAADWLSSQPPMDFTLIQHAEIGDAETGRLAGMMYDALRTPLVAAIQAADDIHTGDDNLAAMAFITLVQSTRAIPYIGESYREINHKLIDMLLNGWRV